MGHYVTVGELEQENGVATAVVIDDDRKSKRKSLAAHLVALRKKDWLIVGATYEVSDGRVCVLCVVCVCV